MSDVNTRPENDESMIFEVHPSVLFKLGEDLIKDDAQALVELIKNSYDADARVVRVKVDTESLLDPNTGATVARAEPLEEEPSNAEPTEPVKGAGSNEESPTKLLKGRVRVLDDGVGMSVRQIQSGWLTVSASEKRDMKAEDRRTVRKRTPLGDKGLGRLGVQRLGQVVALQSVPATVFVSPDGVRRTSDEEPQPDDMFLGSQTNSVTVDWERFHHAKTLSEVQFHVSTVPGGERNAGTVIDVRGLRNVEFWTNSGAERKLERELISIISPYENANGVKVFVELNGEALDLRTQAKAVLEAAPIRYDFSYKDEEFTVNGWLSSALLTGRTIEDRDAYAQLIAPDNGFTFVDWLVRNKGKQLAQFGIASGDDKDFVHLRYSFALRDVARGETQDPGPFSGEVSSIDMEDITSTYKGTRVDFKEFAKDMGGIRVYRDGFGIRLERDWLKLGDQQTSGGSWYGLRSGNAVGYVNLSATDNPLLEETTSREAFKDTAAWRSFADLMNAWVKYVRDAQGFIRRQWNDYRKLHYSQLAQINPASTPLQITAVLSARIKETREVLARSEAAVSALDGIDASVEELKRSREDGANGIWSDPQLGSAVDGAVVSIKQSQMQARRVLDEVSRLAGDYESMRGVLALLEQQTRDAQEQLAFTWETAALGLSAETLTHEINHISERLRGKSAQILSYFQAQVPVDTRSVSFAEEVRSTANDLSVQVARMNPSLRFRREQKQTFLVSDVLASISTYFSSRWANSHLSIDVQVRNDFQIRMNEGKFTQIVDNLLLNSEYWLRRDLRQRRIDDGLIRVVIDAPYVTVSDNGPGIDPSVSATLFEPFVTAKPSDQGRGLGLFIVTQLLESEGASIDLTPELNRDGRHFEFRVELQSVISKRTNTNRDGD